MKIMRSLVKRILMHESAENLYYRSIRYYRKGGFFRYYSYLLTSKVERIFASSLSSKASIGENLQLKHPFAVVIGEGAVIGKNVTIYQSVTLGAARLGEGNLGLYPKVEDNVVIYAGAVVIGDVIIGHGSIIGANAVVTKDVPANSLVGGVPAKVLKRIETFK